MKSQIKAVVGEERHLHYTVCRREVDNMPEFASNYDLIFILGSSDITMNNYQTSWKESEGRLIKSIISSRTPTIGICWGQTHIGAVLGAEVKFLPGFKYYVQTTNITHQSGCVKDIESYHGVCRFKSYVKPGGELTIHSQLEEGVVDMYSYKKYILGMKNHIDLSKEVIKKLRREVKEKK